MAAALRLQHGPSFFNIQPPWQLFKAESTRVYVLVIIGPSRRASGGKMLVVLLLCLCKNRASLPRTRTTGVFHCTYTELERCYCQL